MKSQTIEIQPNIEKVSSHALWESFAPKSIIQFKDISFNDLDISGYFLMILRTTLDSPEYLEDQILKVTENESQIPVCSIDTTKFKLEILILPVEIENFQGSIEIKIAYY